MRVLCNFFIQKHAKQVLLELELQLSCIYRKTKVIFKTITEIQKSPNINKINGISPAIHSC